MPIQGLKEILQDQAHLFQDIFLKFLNTSANSIVSL